MCTWVLLAGLLTSPSIQSPSLLPYAKLAPAKHIPGLCTLHYRISTTSEECQKLFDQGLAYWYSYVWTEAARSFETAARHDPGCAMAWWGLSRALEQWGARSSTSNEALQKAYDLREKASYPEKQLILARATLRGIAKDAPTEISARQKGAQKILDDLLLMHPDDEEIWIAKALLASEGRLFGGSPSSAPFYHALLKINPLHPGANHELVHQYESSKRPTLGWAYSQKYIESSPGIPHSWHMQGHLATRLGRWEHAAQGTQKAITLQRNHNQEWKVKPQDDHQWSHHLETCLQIYTHQGRFREARAVYDEMLALKYNTPDAFLRLHLAQRDFPALLKQVDEVRKKNKAAASYFAALAHLSQGNTAKAQSEIDVLEEAFKSKKDDKKLQYRLWETRGLILCKTGHIDQGLALLQKAADASKTDYGQHAWGHGAYYMEVWGRAALAARRDDVAEEAFLEAIAHDPGSLQGALGLQVLSERQDKHDEAKRYQAMAERAWQHADVKSFMTELAEVRQLKASTPLTSSAGR